jgi:hypothetical protein
VDDVAKLQALRNWALGDDGAKAFAKPSAVQAYQQMRSYLLEQQRSPQPVQPITMAVPAPLDELEAVEGSAAEVGPGIEREPRGGRSVRPVRNERSADRGSLPQRQRFEQRRHCPWVLRRRR